MASRQDIEDAVHDTLATSLSEISSLDDPSTHVRYVERTDEPQLPAYEFELFESDLTRGLGSNVEVHNVVRGEDTITVVTRRRRQATVDILAHTSDDNRRAVTTLYDAAAQRFNRYQQPQGNPALLHEDVDEIDVAGTQRIGEPQDRVRGDRLRVQIEYYRFTKHDYESMEHIDIDLTVDDIPDAESSDDSGSVTVEINT